MHIRLVFLLTMLFLSLPAYATEVQNEVDHFVIHLKRFCIDGGLSAKTAQQAWDGAGATSAFNGRFIADNRAELDAEYDSMLAMPGGADRIKAFGPTREEFIERQVRPDRIFYYGTSLFDSPVGKRHYTLSAEQPPSKDTFDWCDLHASFSSVSEALVLVEKAFSLEERQYKRGSRIEWRSDSYPNLKFGAVVDKAISDEAGNFIIEVKPE